MIEMTCSTCGEKAQVQSFLTAAQQPCLHCGRLLMGGSPASSGRPAWEQGPPGQGRINEGGMWLGMLAGGAVGIAAVIGVGLMGRALPIPVQGALFVALSAVLLAPIIAISSFLSMIFLPFSLESVLGDSVWARIARANTERRLAPLFIPFLLLVVCPMLLGALGGSRLTVIEPGLMVTAALGAGGLGALFGAVFGGRAGSRQQEA